MLTAETLRARREKSRYQVSAWNPESNGKRWCESIRKSGLRLVGSADEIIRLNHRGWYSDTYQDSTMRGLVLQLPAKDRQSRYLAARSDPDNEGACLVDMEIHDSKEDAARAADDMAEHDAEKEREYDEAWQKGRGYADLKEEERKDRERILSLCREAKLARRDDTPTICATIRAEIAGLYNSIQESREKRAELANVNGWWKKEYGDVFNEGANETVFKGV